LRIGKAPTAAPQQPIYRSARAIGMIVGAAGHAGRGNHIGVDLQPDDAEVFRARFQLAERLRRQLCIGVIQGGSLADVHHLQRAQPAREHTRHCHDPTAALESEPQRRPAARLPLEFAPLPSLQNMRAGQFAQASVPGIPLVDFANRQNGGRPFTSSR